MAIVPLKGIAQPKTRLADRFDEVRRRQLVQRLFAHVVAVLEDSPLVSEVALLSDVRPAGWRHGFLRDEARGLNVALDACLAARAPRPLLVILPDLPLLTDADVTALLAAAEGGCAVAPDQAGSGSNAVALGRAPGFAFGFGPGSCARHVAAAGGAARLVVRPGLALDIDTPADFDRAAGHAGAGDEGAERLRRRLFGDGAR